LNIHLETLSKKSLTIDEQSEEVEIPTSRPTKHYLIGEPRETVSSSSRAATKAPESPCYRFQTSLDWKPERTIAVFNDKPKVKWSRIESISLSRIFPNWADMAQHHTTRPEFYKVMIWERQLEVELSVFCFPSRFATWLFVDWVYLFNCFFAAEKRSRYREQLQKAELQCFLETANRFKEEKITFEEALDLHLAHLSGTRHQADREKGMLGITIQPRSNLYSILNSHLVAGAVKNCIEDPDFKTIDDVHPLKDLLVLAWNGDLTAIQEAVAKQESEYYFQLPMLEIFTAIAFVQSHLGLLSYLLTLTSPPSSSIFDKVYAPSFDEREYKTGPGLSNAACWLRVIDAGWLHPPFRTPPLMYNAISGADSQAIISLLERIDAIKVDIFPINLLFKGWGPAWEVAKWAVPQLIALGRKIDPGALRRAASMREHGPEAIQMLLDAGVDLDAKSDLIRLSFSRDGVVLGEMPGGGGETALMIACRSGRRDNVEALLKLGANTSLRDGWEKSAWDRAKEAGRSDIMELLENFQKKPEGPVISEY